jgi:hypothetical protein
LPIKLYEKLKNNFMKNKLLFGILFLTTFVNAQLILRSPFGVTMDKVQFTGTDNGFAIAYSEPDGSLPQGVLKKSIDGGISWTSFPITFSPTFSIFPSINTVSVRDKFQMITQNIGYLIGVLNTDAVLQNVILKTMDGGLSWIGYPLPANTVTGGIDSMFFTDLTTGYIGSNNEIYKTTNSGATWNLIYTATGGQIETIFFINQNIGFASSTARVFKTTDAGVTWNSISIPSGTRPTDMKFVSNSTGYFATSNGRIYCTTDTGDSWNLVYSENNAPLKAISIINNKIFIVGNYNSIVPSCNAFIVKSTDGINWNKECFSVTSNTVSSSNSIFFVTETKGFLGITNGVYEYNTTLNTYYFENNDFDIYPNPSNGIFTIKTNDTKNLTWKVYNNLGQKVSKGNSSNIDLTSFSSGLYLLELNADGIQKQTKKIIKK